MITFLCICVGVLFVLLMALAYFVIWLADVMRENMEIDEDRWSRRFES